MVQLRDVNTTDIAILPHSQDDPQMYADRRRIGGTRRSTARIVQIILDCYIGDAIRLGCQAMGRQIVECVKPGGQRVME